MRRKTRIRPFAFPGDRMTRPRFNRILLKLSGEALMGAGQFGIDQDAVASLAQEVKAAATRASNCAW